MNATHRPSVLLIYTGGTIGMVADPETGAYKPFDYDHLYKHVPEIKSLEIDLDTLAFEEPLDSSDMNPRVWNRLGAIIQDRYNNFDGFVILHGSDTMAYTASALSFLLEDMNKPVILTGSQLPIGVIRTDGKENLITAIEIAAACHERKPIVPEVAIYFEYKLYRGNRTTKISATSFEAFDSPNYPVLADAGVKINFDLNAIKKTETGLLTVHAYNEDVPIALLKLYPGIPLHVINAILEIPGIRAVVMETYGSGNAPSDPAFLEALHRANANGVLVVNITQCTRGTVMQGRYQTSFGLAKAGVISGFDMTTEAAVTKLMHLLSRYSDQDEVREAFQTPLCGELSLPASLG